MAEETERRLIIVIVAPGEDPAIEYEPEESFATYEVKAALERSLELIEEEDLLAKSDGSEGEETEQ